jgi:hypothetical protein
MQRGASTPFGLVSQNTPPSSTKNSYNSGTSEQFSRYSTLEGAWPDLTLPKAKILLLSCSCGPTAVAWHVSKSLLPPAVDRLKLSQEKVPVALGVYSMRITE